MSECLYPCCSCCYLAAVTPLAMSLYYTDYTPQLPLLLSLPQPLLQPQYDVTPCSSLLSVFSLRCSSSLAGGLASFLTSPLDLAKLRLQVDRSRQRHAGLSAFHSSEYVTYRSFSDVLRQAFVNEGGVKGLYRGAFARVSVVWRDMGARTCSTA